MNRRNPIWDSFVPFVRFAYNIAKHEATKESPFFLMHGFDAALPIDRAVRTPPQQVSEAAEYKEMVVSRLEHARRLAHDHIVHTQAARVERSREAGPTTNFRIGDSVLCKRKVAPKGLSKKLASEYVGPYRITRLASEQNVWIRPVSGLAQEDTLVNVREIKRYEEALKPPAKPPQLKIGDIVWAKIRFQPYWPARICAPGEGQANIKQNEFLVQFFKKGTYGVANRLEVFPYTAHKAQFRSAAKGLHAAMAEAEDTING